jgi:hypothetical protein
MAQASYIRWGDPDLPSRQTGARHLAGWVHPALQLTKITLGERESLI